MGTSDLLTRLSVREEGSIAKLRGGFPRYAFMDKTTHQMKFRSPFVGGSKSYKSVQAILKTTLKHPILDEEYTRQGINRLLGSYKSLVDEKAQAPDEKKVLDKAVSIFSTPFSPIRPWEVEGYIEQILWDNEDRDIDEEWPSLKSDLGAKVCENLFEKITSQLIEPVAINFTFWNDAFNFAGTASIVELAGRLTLLGISVSQKVSKTQSGIKLAASLGSYGVSATGAKKIYLPNDMPALLIHVNGSKVDFHHYSNEEMALHKRHFMALQSINQLADNDTDVIER